MIARMLASLLRRLGTPGALPPRLVEACGIGLILAVFILDTVTPPAIRMRVLYVFPLAWIAIHSGRQGVVLFAFLVALLCELVSLYWFGLPWSANLAEVIITVAAFALVVLLSKSARENHLQVVRLATHDSLTGLPNRRGIEESLTAEIERQKRYGGVFSLMFIDLDNFKQLNDTRGHHVGDQALALLGAVLVESIRKADFPARLGGDEFVVLMPNTEEEPCSALCTQIAARMDDKMQAAGYATTATIGYVTFTQPPDSAAAALQQADKAMYQAKSGKRVAGPDTAPR